MFAALHLTSNPRPQVHQGLFLEARQLDLDRHQALVRQARYQAALIALCRMITGIKCLDLSCMTPLS